MLLLSAQHPYTLRIWAEDKDSAFISQTLKIKKDFFSKEDCTLYIDQILSNLYARGYIAASIDSIQSDSTAITLRLFIGDKYQWDSIHIDEQSRHWLSQIGWDEHVLKNNSFDRNKLFEMQSRMFSYFENNGYPFAKIYLQDFRIYGNKVSGSFSVKTGSLYFVDSIKIRGNATISKDYLQQFLNIKNGSIYNKEKLQNISSELKKLNYVEEKFPPQFIWRSTGGVVELFLEQKKSSQVNILVGFLPGSNVEGSNKLKLTGEGLLNLKNAFGNGENIGVRWQKLLASSQQLNIHFQQPYLFKSPFGIDFGFNLLKKDSAFLNFDLKLGALFSINNRQTGKLYIQRFSSIVNAVDTSQIALTKRLPEEADVRVTNLGFEYYLNTTNYIFNPINGFEVSFNTSAGNKIIKPNHQILELKDPNNPDFDFSSLYDTIKTKSYQLKSVLSVTKYFPLGKNRSTVKASINGGYISGSHIFRNELFQIGGYRLLRGFDEQSQFLSQYGIATLEYRYLVGENSYFNVFSDGGWGKDNSGGNNKKFNFLAAGLGLSFETKAGLFNLAWAVGKRNDTNFNLRQSKIHFGFINYF